MELEEWSLNSFDMMWQKKVELSHADGGSLHVLLFLLSCCVLSVEMISITNTLHRLLSNSENVG